MRNISWATGSVIVSIAFALLGQLATVRSYGAGTTTANASNAAPYAVVERGANYRILERTNYEALPSGELIPHVRRVTELATGLNFTNSQTGQWMPSKEEIDLLPDGSAAATQGQHQAYFPPDIYSGVIEVVTPDGQHLKSRPVGISYDDGTHTVLVAQLKDCVGEIVGANQVTYPDAFKGIKADIRVTYTRSGIEQDVILREQPPTPDSYGLRNARMQLLTEFLDTPSPVQKVMPSSSNGLPDTQLTFGAMRMQRGRAFLLSGTSPQNQIPVCKSWVNVDGRTLLVEELTYDSISAQLQQLPAASTAMHTGTEPALCKVSKTRLLPLVHLAQENEHKGNGSKIIRIAKAASTPGLVLDYFEVNGNYSTYTFSPGTYFVSGPVYCQDATLEGGAIIKYANDTTTFIELDGTFACDTGPYNPAIFTAADDDTIGESLSGWWSGYTGSIQSWNYANPALRGGNQTYHNIQIYYAQQAVSAFWGSGVTLADSQIINCNTGVGLLWQGGTATLKNCLIAAPLAFTSSSMQAALTGGGTGSSFNLYFCTIDNCSELVGIGTDQSTQGSVRAADSIFANVADFGATALSGGYNGFYPGSYWFGDNYRSAPGDADYYSIFTAEGVADDTSGRSLGGCYYLGDGTFQSYGTTDPAYLLDSTVLTDIRKKTTTAPICPLLSSFNTDQTFGPGNPDSNPSPNLGFHYDRMDYLLAEDTVSANLTFHAGTVVGWASMDGQEVNIAENGQINFNGTAENPCYFVASDTVMELNATPAGIAINSTATANAPQVRANFTHFSQLGDNNYFGSVGDVIAVSAANCEFLNGSMCNSYTGITLNLFNCLLDQNVLDVLSTRGGAPASLTMVNCTATRGEIEIARIGTGPVTGVNFTNCAFDEYVTEVNDDAGIFCNDNAYLSGATRLPNDSSGPTVTNFNWQKGPLGDFYLPNDFPAQDGRLLSNAGSTTADKVGNTFSAMGLYDFTTQIGPDHEGLSQVDIGYHYISPIIGTVWMDDAVPQGATADAGGGDSWNWVSGGPAPFSENLAVQSSIASGAHQLFFYSATATMTVNSGDILIAYVYLDPANPPSEVMLQWYDGSSWEHRAYWGANDLAWGFNGTAGLYPMGALPASGQWVRLEVPASVVGLEGLTVSGMAFTLYGGRATWDYAGKNNSIPNYWKDMYGLAVGVSDGLQGPNADPDGDGLSNLQEYQQGSNPVRPDGVNLTIGGYAYKQLTPAALAGTGKAYDVYYRPNPSAQWRRVSTVVPGQKTLTLVKPDAGEGDYIFLDATDTDGDGLSDGYENWFTHTPGARVVSACAPRSSQLTCTNTADSLDSGLLDGWKVAHGLNPMDLGDLTDPNNPSYVVAGDTLNNLRKQTDYNNKLTTLQPNYATYDPLNVAGSTQVRPVVTISQSASSAINTAQFTITRDVGGDASGSPPSQQQLDTELGSALTVYYAVGGDLTYGKDYTLYPAPLSANFPAFFSAQIPSGQTSVTVTVNLISGAVSGNNLVVTLVPYGSVQ